MDRQINQMKKRAVLENIKLSRAQISAVEHRLQRTDTIDSFRTETDMDRVTEKEGQESFDSLDDLVDEPTTKDLVFNRMNLHFEKSSKAGSRQGSKKGSSFFVDQVQDD